MDLCCWDNTSSADGCASTIRRTKVLLNLGYMAVTGCNDFMQLYFKSKSMSVRLN